MDCKIPITNGFESSKRIKEIIEMEHVANIPIIGYASLLTENEMNKSKKNRMDEIYEKPLTYQ